MTMISVGVGIELDPETTPAVVPPIAPPAPPETHVVAPLPPAATLPLLMLTGTVAVNRYFPLVTDWITNLPSSCERAFPVGPMNPPLRGSPMSITIAPATAKPNWCKKNHENPYR
jgi:hypothetical protein